MNPFDPDIFAAELGCLPCCNQPAECACALLIPIFGSPYADYATAKAVVDDPDQVVDCYGYYFNSFGGSITSLGVDVSVANQVTWSSVRSSPSEFGQYLNVALKSGDTLTLDFSGTMHSPASPTDVPSVSFVVYDCTGTQVHSDAIADMASGTMSWSVTADGIYYVLVFWGACVATPACGWSTGTAVISSANLVVNPVIALWDDSGTTRKLWACPKLLLPPLTESTGDWYADCAAAASDISSWVDNCVGYFGTGCSSFSATNGGSSLSLSLAGTTGFGGGIYAYGGINAEAGETVSFAWNATSALATARVTASIYDDEGNLVWTDTDTGTTGTLTSSALPYTGRYTILVDVNDSPPFLGDDVTGDFVVTSSGTMSVNEIAAAYDVGLTCPALLLCGDSCP